MEGFRCACLVLAMSTTVLSTWVNVRNGPVHTASRVGQPARVNCTTDLVQFMVLRWNAQFVTSTPETLVYTGSYDNVVIPSEWEATFEGDSSSKHDLVIKSLAYDTAGEYECDVTNGLNTTDPGFKRKVSLMAIESLKCPDNKTDAYNEGDNIIIECSVQLTGTLEPTMKWYIGEEGPMTENVYHNNTVPTEKDKPRVLRYMYKFNASKEHDMAELSCLLNFEAGSGNLPPPTYSDECTSYIMVNHNVTDIKIEKPDNINVGDFINCTAHGRPQPHFLWTKIEGSSSQVNVTGFQLEVTAEMEGQNKYRCTASNAPNDIHSEVTAEVSFFVGVSGASYTSASFLLMALATCITSLWSY